jgi:hypothetical protein
MAWTSMDPLKRSPESLVREARDARDRAIADGFRWLWRKLAGRSRPGSHRPFAENTGAVR